MSSRDLFNLEHGDTGKPLLPVVHSDRDASEEPKVNGESACTFNDLVRVVFNDPTMTDDETDYILWELTPFPMVQGLDDLVPLLTQERDRRITERLDEVRKALQP